MKLFGEVVCSKTFCRLLGVGSGRFTKLRNAARVGAACPLDGRLRKAGGSRRPPKQPHTHELIHEYLMELYLKSSEPVPEANANHAGVEPEKTLKFRKRKGKRPRCLRKRDEALTETTVKGLRLLPPGSCLDYFRLFKAKNVDSGATFKTFLRVTLSLV